MKVTVLGAGAWGTALAQILHQNGNSVTLWGRSSEQIESLKNTGRHEAYLPGIDLPRDWTLTSDWSTAIEEADCLVVAVPSRSLRQLTAALKGYKGIVVSVTKGIEYETGLTMSGVVRENVQQAEIVAMSGPTLAYEVVTGMPSAIVAAGDNLETAEVVQRLFHRARFRVYTNTDMVGVELGGALKNCIAIAAGIGDGLGFGDNSKAALVTRGIVEMRRLGVACGAQADTFSGLSGLGDLTLTCFARRSRNRQFGERLGQGDPLETLLNNKTVTVEGHPTTRSAFQMAVNKGVVTPIINEVHAVLYEGKDVSQAIDDLTMRSSKQED